MSWTEDMSSCYWIGLKDRSLLKGYGSCFSILRASGDGLLHLELLRIRTFPWPGIQDNNTMFREVNLFPSSGGIVGKRLLTRIRQKGLLSVTGPLKCCVLLFYTRQWKTSRGVITLSLTVFFFALPYLFYGNLKALKVKSKQKCIAL